MTSPVRISSVSARILDAGESVLLTLAGEDGGEPATFELRANALGELISILTRLDRDIINDIEAYQGGPEGP